MSLPSLAGIRLPAAITFGLVAFGAPARAQHWMDSPRYHTDNLDGYFQAIGDVDGDGDKDLISHVGPFAYPAAYRVYRNDGAGAFVPDPDVPLPATHTYFAVKPGLADVTGDGLLDLLFRAQTSGPVYGIAVFPGTGGGAFGAMVFTPLSGNVKDIDVADNDGDPALEIAVAHHATSATSSDIEVRWLDWNGAGFTASTAVVIPQYLPTLEGVASVEAFDWSGDGLADIVTGSEYNTQVRRLLTVAGQPQTGAPVSIPLNSPNTVLLNKGDINNDGVIDVLAIGVHYDSTPSTVYGHLMVLRFSPGGAFTAGPQTNVQNFPDDFALTPVVLDDWDGDGDLDLVTNTWTASDEWRAKIGFFRRNPTDTFTLAATARTYSLGGIAGVADVDGDGKHDAVAPKTIVYGSGTFTNTPYTTPFSGFQLANVKSTVTDHNDDGDFDLLDVDGRLLANDATGALGTTQADLQALLPTLVFPSLWGDAVAHGDFDGDGVDDLLVPRLEVFVMFGIFREMHLLHGAPDGKFVDAGFAAPAGVEITDLSVNGLGMCPTGDLDGDGDRDVIAAGGYWPNLGNGTFGAFVPLFAGTPRAVADVEPDGDLDVLTLNWVGGIQFDLGLLRQGPGFTFSQTSLLVDELAVPSGALIDLDGDGDFDVAEGARSDGTIHLLRNDGAGFTHLTATGAAAAADVFGLGDVDGDGVTDLLTASYADLGASNGAPVVQVLRRTAPGALTFEPSRAFLAGSARGFADADQDGDVDLMGGVIVKNRLFDGAADGTARQYGKGTAGTGGGVPVLGARGPLRPGTTTAQIRVRRARGGSSAIFFVSLAQAALPIGYGTTLLVSAPIPIIATFPLTGASGVAGAGELDFDVSAFVPAAAGFSFFHQVFVVDPAHPLGAAASNGLELHYGL